MTLLQEVLERFKPSNDITPEHAVWLEGQSSEDIALARRMAKIQLEALRREEKLNITSINVDIDGDQILITDTVTDNYGVGDTFLEALLDYCQSVLEWDELRKTDNTESVGGVEVMSSPNTSDGAVLYVGSESDVPSDWRGAVIVDKSYCEAMAIMDDEDMGMFVDGEYPDL